MAKLSILMVSSSDCWSDEVPGIEGPGMLSNAKVWWMVGAEGVGASGWMGRAVREEHGTGGGSDGGRAEG